MNHTEKNTRINKSLYYLTIILLLIAGTLFLRSSAVFTDMEARWQRFFYDFYITLANPPNQPSTPFYVVVLDDRSLPDNTCRSPVNKIWLNQILLAVAKQSPAAVGLNIILTNDNSKEDQLLTESISALGNVVLLDSSNSATTGLYPAKSRGSMIYRTTSTGDVQYVCANPALCGCSSSSGCTTQRFFMTEILKISKPEASSWDIPQKNGWMKLFFQYTPDDFRQSLGKRPWTTISANELLKTAPGTFQPGSIVLIGTGFTDLYPRYRLPVQSPESSTGLEMNQSGVSGLELSALVLDQILSRSFLIPVPIWLEVLVLLVCLLGLTWLVWNKYSFVPFWLSIALLVIWNLTAALLFVFFKVELTCVLPNLSILLLSLLGLRQQQLEAKFEKLSLESRLEKERFNGLVDQFHTHSVFNALDHIRYLIRTKSQDAEQYLLDYSTLLLDDLRHDPQRLYPLKEQWDYIQNYLNLQKLRHQSTIELEYSVQMGMEDFLEKIHIPWKLFYPLAENAFKHTKLLTDSSKKELKIRIILSMEASSVGFTIINPFDETSIPSGSRQGLINLKKRLALLFPSQNWTLKESNDNSFWTSYLQVPASYQ